MRFDQLGLKETVLTAITESGYENPTPIQAQAIPLILEGKDLIGASQTGTGKTAAFALPSLSKIEALGKPQILVLEPTRELAHQVAEQFEHYGKHTGCKVALLYGGVGHGKQDEDLKNGADIVVATPGRLIDHFFRGTMRFGAIKVLILDEVDRMLDMGFLPQVRKIINFCPWNNDEQTRQTLFFSATMPPVIKGFAEWCLTDPESVEIARAEVASTVSHSFFPVAMPQRDELLLALLSKTDYNSVMIFTRTRKEADVVSHLITDQVGDIVAVMHSDIKQNDRMKALKGFKEGRYKILVATDVAARGIDISDVTHVINYRVPENAEDYVHRIGRTGRAEKEGDAFTILTADELEFAESVEGFVNKKIERKKLDGFEYQYTAMLDTEKRKPIRKPRRGGGRKRR
ncbi:MAG: DEAD/DEAH box helicase [Akkermansiaceae bacterium]|jgi:ATP-dependent RNA helicase RhlE|nr:DEAD/DEAH box helicase [Akkermansiaceae bacterium]MDG1071140.1 DEAD/DEAH box helicase [Akkermansiaceae bacterium]MDG1670686.1 DEAD/DEAH box helicase [Akkermansiaceae bacterium]MDG2322899.1 DEAD/DEAH box helicase [Akkermansiaceae bacterium]OUV13840.1 MAG: RNA helicase [Verrucomicrobiaceae bacterium TMED86]